MANSLEVRVPLLNPKLLDLSADLARHFKVGWLTTKYLLRRAMQDLLPPAIVRRRKKGFNMPVAKWLTGPLKPLATDLLAPARLRRHGLFNAGLCPDPLAGTSDPTPRSSQAAVDPFGFRTVVRRMAGMKTGRQTSGRLLCLGGLLIFILVQGALMNLPLANWSLTPELDDSLTYVLKTRQMQECWWQTCPALDDLRQQLQRAGVRPGRGAST